MNNYNKNSIERLEQMDEDSKYYNVDHPAHYQGKHECIDIMLTMFGKDAVAAFCKCNSFKYRFRAGKKEGSNADDDIKKAEWYENYLMELTKGEGASCDIR